MDKSLQGHQCFLCLGEISTPGRPSTSPPQSGSRRLRFLKPEPGGAPVPAHSIQYLARYLKLTVAKSDDKNEEEVTPSDRPQLGLLGRGVKTGGSGLDLDDQKLKVGLCGDCVLLNDTFGRVYKELEEVEMRLISCLSQIQQKMLERGRGTKVMIQNLDEVRSEAMQKCSQILRTAAPRVMLEKLRDEEMEDVVQIPELISQDDNDDNYKPLNKLPPSLSCEEVMPSSDMEMEIEIREVYSLKKVELPDDLEQGPDDPRVNDLRDLRPKSLEVDGKKTGQAKPTPLLQCQYCQKTFLRRDRWINHVRTHTGEKPHRCQYCEKSFIARGNWKKHQDIHNNIRRHKCLQCHQLFRERHRLVSHQQRTGHRGQAYLDSQAKKLIPTVIKIPKDLIISCVEDEDPVPSPGPSLIQTKSKPSSSSSLQTPEGHPSPKTFTIDPKTRPLIQTKTKPSSSSSPQTPEAPKSFTIDPKSRHYRCNLCPLVFEKFHGFWMHEKQSHPKDKFRCPECGEEFALREEYTRHRATHKFECLVCHRTFPLKGYLTNHQQRSNCRVTLGFGKTEGAEQNPKAVPVPVPQPGLKCILCLKLFRTDKSLKTHMKIMHAAEEAHVCDVCGSSFTQRAKLTRHLAKHHNPNLHQCFGCKTWFVREDDLASHQQRTGHV